MKRLLFCIVGLVLNTIACAALPDLSGTYQCHGWDSITGKFKNVKNSFTLTTTSKDKNEQTQGYAFTIKNYGDEKAQYTGFGTTFDGIHVAIYFANSDPKTSTDYGVAQLVFNLTHNAYSGEYYQPTFALGDKKYNYGHVICTKIKGT